MEGYRHEDPQMQERGTAAVSALQKVKLVLVGAAVGGSNVVIFKAKLS